MSNIAIRVENLSKQYQIGVGKYRHDSIRDHLTEWVRSLFVRNGTPSPSTLVSEPSALGPQPSAHSSQPANIIWALNDVSFEVKHGEAIGIIGRNGSGKSTLLKILSRITEPTSGLAEINGRVGSLLEVGTGFHRDLTGRENIYLNGAILGMKKTVIDRKFDEIVDFSGVEKFIDTPVKRFSSGMYVRLAFAVAAHLDPEILIVDEVLAVGDAEFQTKCLGKMIDVANEGRTVLFVSHNAPAVKNLCHNGIMLNGGKVVFNGTAEETVDFYLRSVEKRKQTRRSHMVDLSKAPSRRVGYRPLLQRLELFTDNDKPLDGPLKVGAALKAYIYFRLEKPTSTVDATLAFDNLSGQRILHTHSAYQSDRPQGNWLGDHIFVCEIPSLTLVHGEYKVKVALDIDNSPADIIEDATRLTIVQSDYYGTGKLPQTGFFVVKHSWQLT